MTLYYARAMRTALAAAIEEGGTALLRPLPSAGLRQGEIIGHRVWYVRAADMELNADGDLVVHEHPVLRLRSMNGDHIWPVGWPMEDRMAYSVSIADHNGSGVYAHKTAEGVAKEFSYLWRTESLWPFVFGTCWMWGTVIEHEHGWRAQYARVRSLDISGNTDLLNELRESYRIA